MSVTQNITRLVITYVTCVYFIWILFILKSFVKVKYNKEKKCYANNKTLNDIFLFQTLNVTGFKCIIIP